jgi:LmbE family N-acetylglucosaminyl deacetylase
VVSTHGLLAILAHPDDPELWAGGVIAAHTRRGPATVAVTSHNQTRNAEAAAGADILGAQLCLLDELTVDAAAQLLNQVRPDVVITHPLHDVHPDHRHAASTVLAALPDAVIATSRPLRLYSCDTYNSLTLTGPVQASTIIDVTDTWEVKMDALAAHRSQPITDHFGPMAVNLGRLWGARIGTAYAEAFHVLPVLGRIPAATEL